MTREIEIGPYMLQVFDRLPEPLDKVEPSHRLSISETMRQNDLVTFFVAQKDVGSWFRVHWVLVEDRNRFLLLQQYDRTAEDPMDMPCCVVRLETEHELEVLPSEQVSQVLQTMTQAIGDSFERLGQAEAFRTSRHQIHQLFSAAAIAD